jgi:membrane dipeptidase
MNRREFLAASSVTALTAATTPATAAAKKPKSFRVIDTHLHLFNTKLEGKNGVPVYIRNDATVEAALVALGRGGVSKAFLISYAAADVGVQVIQRGFRPAALKNVISKEYQVASWKAHKDRFWWFTDHIDPNRKGYLKDLEKDFDTGAAGIKLLPWFHGLLPDHPGFIKVFEVCRKYKKPVILDLSWWYFHLHPLTHEPLARRKLVKSFADYGRLLAPLFRRFADVPISLAHAGTAKTERDYADIFALIAAHPNVSCDLAAATGYSAKFIQRLVKAVGAHKVMYGTDWPYWSSGPDSYRGGERRWTMITGDCPGLSDAEKQMILAGNAERFVKNLLPDDSAARARTLHQRSIVTVIHDHNTIAPDVPRMLAGGVTAKVYQVGIDVNIGPNFRDAGKVRIDWKQRARTSLEQALRTIKADPKRLLLALTAADIERAKRAGKVAILLGVEGGKLLEGDLANLRLFHRLGLRELQLRWAVPNQIVERDTLTDFGRLVIKECQRLGVIVDLTHIPPKAFDQAVELAKKPLIVSHGTGRELGDARLKALRRLRGVVGIHFYSSYLGERPSVAQVLDAIDFIAARAGPETVALGVDFFPTEGKWAEFQRAQGTKDISWAVPDLSHMPEVTRGLVARGYTDKQIEGILGKNFLRICKEVFGR